MTLSALSLDNMSRLTSVQYQVMSVNECIWHPINTIHPVVLISWRKNLFWLLHLFAITTKYTSHCFLWDTMDHLSIVFQWRKSIVCIIVVAFWHPNFFVMCLYFVFSYKWNGEYLNPYIFKWQEGKQLIWPIVPTCFLFKYEASSNSICMFILLWSGWIRLGTSKP